MTADTWGSARATVLTSRRRRRLLDLRARFPTSVVVNAVVVGMIDRRHEPHLPPTARAVRDLTGRSVTLVAGETGIALWRDTATGVPSVVLPWSAVRSVAGDMHELLVSTFPMTADNIQFWPVVRVIAVADGIEVDLPIAIDRDRRGQGVPNPLDQFALRAIVDSIEVIRVGARPGV